MADLGVVCQAGKKASGVTGLRPRSGTPSTSTTSPTRWATSSAATTPSTATPARAAAATATPHAAYEPGSGSTIMAYAGICGADDLQPNSDDYFHAVSLDEIVAYSHRRRRQRCAVGDARPATPPRPSTPARAASPSPRSTPFAHDRVGDRSRRRRADLRLGGVRPAARGRPAPDNPAQPALLPLLATVASPSRTFPRLSDIVNNTTAIGEMLPNVAPHHDLPPDRPRQPGGRRRGQLGERHGQRRHRGRPVPVTAPNTAAPRSWIGVTTETVTWNVANTNAAPVNCAAVNIRLSTDGGLTYPTALASNTPNDGTETIVVPNINTTTARVEVDAQATSSSTSPTPTSASRLFRWP